jgi:hypothetical protein
MPIAYVNGTGKLNASSVATTAGSGVIGWTPTNGNTLTVTISGWHASGFSASGVSDNNGNTYSLVYDSGAISGGSRILVYAAWAYNGTGAPTVTVANVQASANFLTWSVQEFSGLLTSGYEAAASALATGATSGVDAVVTAAAANTDANSLVFALLVYPTGTTITISTPSGYTALYNEGDSGDLAAQGGYKIVSASTAQTASWSYDDTAVTWGAAVVVLAGARGVGWTEGAGTSLASDEVNSAHHQRQKWTHGADGAANDASATAPMPVQQLPTTSGGASVYKLVSATGTNSAAIKTSPGLVYGVIVGNTNSSPRYLKLYNSASAPTVGTTTPAMTIPVHRLSKIDIPQGVTFSSGIGIAITTGAADSDTGGVVADEVTATVLYK